MAWEQGPSSGPTFFWPARHVGTLGNELHRLSTPASKALAVVAAFDYTSTSMRISMNWIEVGGGSVREGRARGMRTEQAESGRNSSILKTRASLEGGCGGVCPNQDGRPADVKEEYHRCLGECTIVQD